MAEGLWAVLGEFGAEGLSSSFSSRSLHRRLPTAAPRPCSCSADRRPRPSHAAIQACTQLRAEKFVDQLVASSCAVRALLFCEIADQLGTPPESKQQRRPYRAPSSRPPPQITVGSLQTTIRLRSGQPAHGPSRPYLEVSFLPCEEACFSLPQALPFAFYNNR